MSPLRKRLQAVSPKSCFWHRAFKENTDSERGFPLATEQVLLTEQRGSAEWVTLNRPDAGNALNAELVGALAGYFEGLRDREDIRVVVLRARGKHFCVGLDLSGAAFAEEQAQPT